MDSARPELTKHNSWQRHDYAKNFDKEYPVKDKSVKNNIDYVNVSGWTDKDVLKFEQHYIKNKIPCVLRGGMEDWQAMTKWSKRRLLKKYRNQSFKCGEDDDGHNVKIKMKYYLEYMENTTDDSPLYIFDANYSVIFLKCRWGGEFSFWVKKGIWRHFWVNFGLKTSF